MTTYTLVDNALTRDELQVATMAAAADWPAVIDAAAAIAADTVCRDGITIDKLAKMTPEQIAERIQLPLEDWTGNCYGVALLMVQAGLVPAGSRAVYGHWRGPIAKSSHFAGRRGVGFTGHGWVLTEEGQIIDPTRFAFEDVAPYVYLGATEEDELPEVCRNCQHLEDEHTGWGIGRCEGGDYAGYDCGDCCFEGTVSAKARAEARDYDEGGNRFREQSMRPFPTADGPELPHLPIPASTLCILRSHGHTGGDLTAAQVFWTANLPLSVLGGAAEDTYRWLLESGHSAYVPIDNRMKILG